MPVLLLLVLLLLAIFVVVLTLVVVIAAATRLLVIFYLRWPVALFAFLLLGLLKIGFFLGGLFRARLFFCGHSWYYLVVRGVRLLN